MEEDEVDFGHDCSNSIGRKGGGSFECVCSDGEWSRE